MVVILKTDFLKLGVLFKSDFSISTAGKKLEKRRYHLQSWSDKVLRVPCELDMFLFKT